MGKKHQRSPDLGLPIELERSTPRAVTLTVAGRVAVVGVIALFAGALFGVAWLYSRAADRTVTEIVATEAKVTRISRPGDENPRVRVSYRYTVDGREYSGRTRLRKGEDNRFTVGSTVPVEYEASRPEKNWMRGYTPRPIPLWVVALPAVLVLGAVPILMALRFQRRLLAYGRPALARVTDRRHVSNGEYKVWRVHYEWALMNGAIRTGHYDRTKNPPSPGTVIPILYDPDNARRHRPYPLSLVRLY